MRRSKTPEVLATLTPSTPTNSITSGNAALNSTITTTAASSTKNAKPPLTSADKWSLALLFLLYTIQGIPMGLSGSIPMLLSKKGVDLTQQAHFSWVSWPFSLKLLWAPIVDSVFTRRCGLGRRKTWLIPSQFICSILFLILGISGLGDALMGDSPRWWGSSLVATQPDMIGLTVIFLVLYFLMATQDIAVDGWALTMLPAAHVSLGSTANTVGQSLGYFISYIGFLAAYSPEFCNRFIRTIDNADTAKGLMGLSSFCTICGIVMMLTTIAVWLFKHEGRESECDMEPSLPGPAGVDDTEDDMMACWRPISTTYAQMWQIIRLPAVLSLAFVLLTYKIPYGAVDGALTLKLVAKGIPQATLAGLAVVTLPASFVFPLMVTKWTAGTRPLDLMVWAIVPRIALGMVWSVLLYSLPTHSSDQPPEELSMQLYALIFVLTLIHQFVSNMTFCGVMGFFTRVSDPAYGGTYMTLLNTLSNLGGKWTQTSSMYFIEPLTTRLCSVDGAPCGEKVFVEACLAKQGACEITSDGYYMVHNVLTVIGIVWFILIRPRIERLTTSSTSVWRVGSGARSD